MRRGAARGAFALLPLLVLAGSTAFGSVTPQGAPPPTPVPPNGSPSPFISRLNTPADPIPEPDVEAPAILLADLRTGQVLVQDGAHRARPIASLTKLMTAFLVLESEAGRLDRIVRVDPDAVFERDEYGGGSTLGLRPGERISVRGLLAGLLLGSANDAAEALAIEESGTVPAFVRRMNARARELGMRQTRFASPHGLDDRGRSSASDVLILARAALDIGAFRDLVGRRFVTVPSETQPDRTIQNRNVMLWLYPGSTGVKTGSTAGAGFCLVATAVRENRELAVVILGGRDEVFSEAAALFNHGFAAYEPRTLVEDRAPLGSVRVRGGEVPVVAGRELVALVRRSDRETPERIVGTAAGAAYPVPAGAVVGWLRIEASGVTLGRVPLLAADVGPPAAPAGSWWGRTAGAVAAAVVAVVEGLVG